VPGEIRGVAADIATTPEMLPMRRRPNLALRIVLDAILVVAAVLWLPVVRGFFQPGYEWQLFALGGAGRTGDYLPLLGLAGFTWAVLYAGWRRSTSVLFPPLVLSWCVGLAGGLAYVTLNTTDPLVFRGDTLGIELNIGWLGTGIATAMLALAAIGAFVARRGDASEGVVTRMSRVALAVAAVMLPVEALCFLGHDVNGAFSQMGVFAVLVQALALGLALRTGRSRAAAVAQPALV
jgi:hypothetical protein